MGYPVITYFTIVLLTFPLTIIPLDLSKASPDPIQPCTPALIFVAGEGTRRVDIFDQNGQRPYPSFDGRFTPNDGFAVGDIDGDGTDEILVAGEGTGRVDVFNLNNPEADRSFDGRFTLNDGFAVGSVQNPDRDGDGLLDCWEAFGYNPDNDDTIEVNLPLMGADPNHKDLFVELDWTDDNEPTKFLVENVKEVFASAPVDAGGIPNPDGQPGINLWIDTGSLVDNDAPEDGTYAGPACTDGIDNGDDGVVDGDDPDCLVGDNFGGGNPISPSLVPDCGLGDDFYSVRDGNFSEDRLPIFRYGIRSLLSVLNVCGSVGQDGGEAELGRNDFITYNLDSGTFLHELGHNMNLLHGGYEDHNCKPNYVSAMNYYYMDGIFKTVIDEEGNHRSQFEHDYSPPSFSGGRGNDPLPLLDEGNLTEGFILDPNDPENHFVFKNDQGKMVRNPLNQEVNWNGDEDTDDSGLRINVDNYVGQSIGGITNLNCSENSNIEELVGFDDWQEMSLPFRHFGDSHNAPVNAPHPDPDPTTEELLQLREELNTADLNITQTISTGSALSPGEEFTYSLLIANLGPNPASNVSVANRLPNIVSYLDDDADCVVRASGNIAQPSGNTTNVVCSLGEILARENRSVTITARVNDIELIQSKGVELPAIITNDAAVENHAGPDPILLNNKVTGRMTVSNLAPLPQPLDTFGVEPTEPPPQPSDTLGVE